MGTLWSEGGSAAAMHHGMGAVKRVEINEYGFKYSFVVGGRCLGKIKNFFVFLQAVIGTHTVALAV